MLSLMDYLLETIRKTSSNSYVKLIPIICNLIIVTTRNIVDPYFFNFSCELYHIRLKHAEDFKGEMKKEYERKLSEKTQALL